MQRPMMDSLLMLEDDPAVEAARKHPLRTQAEFVARAVKLVARVLFSKPFRIRRREPQDEQPRVGRILKAAGYRLMFAPILIALASSALVFRGTHPLRASSDELPEVPATFYETLEFAGPDGHPLMAWFVPVVDAKRVLELKNKVYRGKHPAVLLVHDFNATPSQMVPLVGPLHEKGYVVMVVGLRGVGRGKVAAQTFGLNESVDVLGALAELRKRPTVDPSRTAVVGVGTGANAAVIAAAQESGVRALVLVDPAETPEQVVAQRIAPARAGFGWMRQPCKWAFEVAYHVDAEDLNLSRFRDTMKERATLTLNRPVQSRSKFDEATIKSIGDFCLEHLPVERAETLAGAAN